MLNKKSVLITGVNSLLGKYCAEQLSKNYQVWGTYHKQFPNLAALRIARHHLIRLNVANQEQVTNLIYKLKPNYIVHLAARSNIEDCEKFPKEANLINVISTKHILKAIKNTPIHLVFSSSNAIFDGKNPPYQENDQPQPLNIYAKTKWLAERLIQSQAKYFTILRFASIFGWPPKGARDNDVTYYLNKLRQTVPLYLVNDRFYNPVFALRAAIAIDKVIKKKQYGIFHIAGQDRITRFTFIQTLVRAFNLNQKPTLIPVASNFFPHLVNRPKDSTLTTAKMESVLSLKAYPLLGELRLLKK